MWSNLTERAYSNHLQFNLTYSLHIKTKPSLDVRMTCNLRHVKPSQIYAFYSFTISLLLVAESFSSLWALDLKNHFSLLAMERRVGNRGFLGSIITRNLLILFVSLIELIWQSHTINRRKWPANVPVHSHSILEDMTLMERFWVLRYWETNLICVPWPTMMSWIWWDLGQ